MTVYHGSSDRFLRPIDLASTPRNYRRLQARRLLIGLANLLLILSLLVAGYWMWRKTQEDVRFAVRRVEITGVVHAPAEQIEAIARAWEGANLFRLDLDRLRAELSRHPWVESVALRKTLPDTLHVDVTERRPVALVSEQGALRYVDRHGVVFADLSPEIGDPDLPVIVGTAPAEVATAVSFLEKLRRESPELYARVSQIAASRSAGFTIWDRDLGTVVKSGPDPVARWTALYGVVEADGWRGRAIAYADLRFRDRIVIMPSQNGSGGTTARSGVPQ